MRYEVNSARASLPRSLLFATARRREDDTPRLWDLHTAQLLNLSALTSATYSRTPAPASFATTGVLMKWFWQSESHHSTNSSQSGCYSTWCYQWSHRSTRSVIFCSGNWLRQCHSKFAVNVITTSSDSQKISNTALMLEPARAWKS